MDKASYIVIIAIWIYLPSVCCVKLEVVPTNVVLSDTGNDVFTVRCSPTTKTPAIASITSIRLYRYTQWDIDSGHTDVNQIAAIMYYDPNIPNFIGNPTDLTTAPRSANLTGRLNDTALADCNVNLEAHFYIQLQLQRRYVRCNDVGMYSCKVTYVDNVDVSHDDEGSQNLTVTSGPTTDTSKTTDDKDVIILVLSILTGVLSMAIVGMSIVCMRYTRRVNSKESSKKVVERHRQYPNELAPHSRNIYEL